MRTALLCGAAVALLCSAALLVPHRSPAAGEPRLATGSDVLASKIERWRQRTWYWQRVMGKRPTPARLGSRSLADRQTVLELWKARAQRAKRRALRLPHRRAWLCIFRYERHPRQGWRTQTGNGYYGGLQMDLAFQRNYGRWLLARKGPAHRWTPIEQIWAAERGRRVQGWYAWPNTARLCGLI